MPYSYEIYLGDGVKTKFTIPCDYLSKSHIKVAVAGVYIDDFDVTGPYEVTLHAAPALDETVQVSRETPRDQPIVDFVDGSTLNERDLDAATLQSLYLSQEAADFTESGIGQDASGNLDATTRRLINLGAPVNGNDAATKSYVDTNKAEILAARDTAVTAASSAVTHSTSAQAAKDAILLDPGYIQVSQDLTGPNTIGIVAHELNTSNDIAVVAENITDIQSAATVVSSAEQILNIADDIAAIGADLQGPQAILTVAENITDIQSAATVVEAAQGIVALADDVEAVSAIAEEVETVAGAVTPISSVASIAGNVTTVAGAASSISSVAGSLSAVNTVAGNLSQINTVSSNVTKISGVHGALSNIDIIAPNISAITTNATNITAIQGAAGNATLAQQWAVRDENSPIPGYPGQFSAKHWALKAQAFAGGNASNITVNQSGFVGLAGSNVQSVLNNLDDKFTSVAIPGISILEDFESFPFLTGTWTEANGGTITRSNDVSASGDYSLKCTGTTNFSISAPLGGTVPITAGKTYSVDVYIPAGGTPHSTISAYPLTGASIAGAATGVWHTLTGVASTTANLQISASGGSGSRTVYIDNLREHIDVPVPLLDKTVNSHPLDIAGAESILNMVSLTQAEYDAIPVKDSSTLYVITDA